MWFSGNHQRSDKTTKQKIYFSPVFGIIFINNMVCSGMDLISICTQLHMQQAASIFICKIKCDDSHRFSADSFIFFFFCYVVIYQSFQCPITGTFNAYRTCIKPFVAAALIRTNWMCVWIAIYIIIDVYLFHSLTINNLLFLLLLLLCSLFVTGWTNLWNQSGSERRIEEIPLPQRQCQFGIDL